MNRLLFRLSAMLLALVPVWGFAQTTKPEARGWAAGAFLGEPTGLTVRYGFSANQSIEAKSAWSFTNGASQTTSFLIQGNYLMEFPGIVVIDKEDFPLYFGVGAEARFAGSTSVDLRIPGGILYRFRTVPIELGLELGLGLQVFPSTALVGSGGIAVRYRF